MADSSRPVPSVHASEARPQSPLILYKPPTAILFLRSAAINLVLPFINGLMLGFGELFAHELAFRWGWGTTRVFPASRLQRSMGPSVEVKVAEKERLKKSERFWGYFS